MLIDTNKLIKQSEIFAQNLITELSNITIRPFSELSFNSSEFRNKEILKECFHKVPTNKHPLIYIIKVEGAENNKLLLDAFEEYHNANRLKTKNKDRVNLSRYNKTASETFYVGSSTTNFNARLKNHLGTEGTRVYSLHLCKWDKCLEYKLNIYTYEVISGKDKAPSRFLVEILEQHLWDELRPVFGKRSGL